MSIIPHRWVQGQSGNPGGKPKLPDELKDIKPFQTDEVKRVIAKTGRMNIDEAMASIMDSGTSYLEKALLRCWQLAAEKGDPIRLEFLLNRTIGRAPMAELDSDADRERVSPEAAALLIAGIKAAQAPKAG